MEIKGVITGDIVGSRLIAANKRSKLYVDLKSCLKTLSDEKWVCQYDLIRGDSFQCLVDANKALRVALMLRSFMKSYTDVNQVNEEKAKVDENLTSKGYLPGKQDMRIAVGIGHLDFIDNDSLAQSDGEAFHLAGEGIDKLKHLPYRMILRTLNTQFNEAIEPSILLLDAVVGRWTTNQAETVMLKLQNMKEENIARKLKISQPAVNQRTKTSQWYAVEKLLTYFSNTVTSWEL